MKQKLIFEDRGIKVIEETYRGARGTIYLITNGDQGFHVGAKPVLEYEYLKEELAEYIGEKELDISADTENEDIEDYSEEDMELFWEPGTEGF